MADVGYGVHASYLWNCTSSCSSAAVPEGLSPVPVAQAGAVTRDRAARCGRFGSSLSIQRVGQTSWSDSRISDHGREAPSNRVSQRDALSHDTSAGDRDTHNAAVSPTATGDPGA